MVLEGFGRIPMNDAAYQLLTTSDKRDVSAIHTAYNPAAGERPEMFIPLPSIGPTCRPKRPISPPTRPSASRASRIEGKIGTIVQVRPGLTVLPNGVRAPAADVRLEQDTQVIIPLANLEVIE